MGLSKYFKINNMVEYKRLGDYIEPIDERNNKLEINLSQGINNNKYFQEPKQVAQNSTADKIVRTGYFAYNRATTRNGEKISIALREGPDCTVSSAYQVFRIKNEELLNPQYLLMWFKRSEFDRYARYKSHGSAHEFFDYEDMCEVYLPIPSIEQQRKYVDVYLSLQNNLATYQSKVDDLKLVCDGYIEDLKRKMPSKRIGDYILESNVKNSDNKIKEVRSVSVTKEFKLTNAKVNKNELSNYLVVHPKEIAFVQTTGNEKVLAFAYNDQDYPVVVSSVDKVFKSKDENTLDLQFLSLYLSRKEFDRYARFNSWGSAREVFTMEDMNDVAIPIPDISVQREIVNIHRCYIERQRIATQLKEQLNNLCPILIKGSLQN